MLLALLTNNNQNKKVGDPHLGLKDVTPELDRIKVMKYIYAKRTHDWQDISVAHTWGNST
jgi:hypothetical protein